NLPKDVVTHLACDDQNTAQYLELVKVACPNAKLTELQSSDAGSHLTPTRNTFTVDVRYFQAIAKIGFHYYLCHTRRNVSGAEPEFAAIRNFIQNGGEVDQFVQERSSQFKMPFGDLGNGVICVPEKWCHLLAVDERASNISAYVQMFVGPKIVSPG